MIWNVGVISCYKLRRREKQLETLWVDCHFSDHCLSEAASPVIFVNHHEAPSLSQGLLNRWPVAWNEGSEVNYLNADSLLIHLKGGLFCYLKAISPRN